MSKPMQLFSISTGIYFLLVAASAVAFEEGIVKNTDGDYIITFFSESGHWIQWQWEPATKIDPSVTWGIKQSSKSDSLAYSFTVANGVTSKQKLDLVRMIVSSTINGTQVIPTGWDGVSSSRKSNIIVSWSFQADGEGIKAGASQNGFGFESNDLPGIGAIELSGYTPTPALKQIYPNDISSFEDISEMNPIRDQFNSLHANDFIPRTAAIPRIAVPNPFDASVVISNIKSHVDTDLVNLKLIDPILVSQFDLNMQAAADAAKLNNIAGAKSNLRDARRLLKEQVPDIDATYNFNSNPNKPKTRLIDPMAAWVVNFDIQYVERRL